MHFDSLDFAIFLPLVFAIYWIIPRKQTLLRNLVILIASYVFYAWWDWRFLSLILFSSLVDYFIAQFIGQTDSVKQRFRLLLVSIFVNLGFLFFFKYFNFFIDSFVESVSFFGFRMEASRLNIVLPVGISFYTFQTLSYTIEVYRKNIQASKNILNYMAYVSFFPQLVAGPIERPQSLLTQFDEEHKFEESAAIDGMRQILWGLVKKVLIADNCALYVNEIFGNYQDQSASSLVLGLILFSFQIYGDFSGYSDIAIGSARLFGFNLRQNFAHPYFSRDIAEFWRRWHISLTSWFKDYLYIPLGGSRGNKAKAIRNVFIVFLVSGLWHGANWTFVVWGLYHAILFVPLFLLGRNRSNIEAIAENSLLPSFRELGFMLICFLSVSFGWLFFRAENINMCFHYMIGMMDSSIFSIPEKFPKTLSLFIVIFIIVEWLGRHDLYAIEKILSKMSLVPRWLVYLVMVLAIVLFGAPSQDFIYFQF